MPRPMKDSGVEWLGDIPAHWKLGRIGQLYTERKEKVSDVDFPPLSVTMKGILPQLSTAAKSDAHDDRKLVRKGDFAINSRSDRRGSCGISSYDGSVSLINIILTPRGEMNPIYYDWLFHSTMFADEFYKWGHGIVDDLWTTNWQDMKKIFVPFPPLDEQQRIATFLDGKCARIDSVIEKTRASIEEYKKLKQALITRAVTKGIRPARPMKHSGVEWLDDIPAHWKTIKIKYTSWLKGRIGWQGLTASEYTDEGAFLVTGTDFQNGIVNWSSCAHISKERFNEDEDIHIKEGDLLITKDGTIGKVAIAKNCPAEVSLNSGVLLIRNVGEYKYHDKYLYYVLLSDEFWKWYTLSQTGQSTIKHLYQAQFYSFEYTFPPLEEQKEIAQYLDEKTAAIDLVVGKKNQLVTELERLKKSLIFEYVTGKKAVAI